MLLCGLSFVKWGTEVLLPPRTVDRAIPPAKILQDLGLNTEKMIYNYSDHLLNWGMAGVHHCFPLIIALFYCVITKIFPAIKLGQGLGFALLATIGLHGRPLIASSWTGAVFVAPPFRRIIFRILRSWSLDVDD